MADRLCSSLQNYAVNCVGEFNSLPRLHCDFMGIKLIDESLINKVLDKSNSLERKRANHNFHASYDDPIQRVLNVFNPGTYVRPHKHENPDKTEVFIILSGRTAVLIFNDEGGVKEVHVLDNNGPIRGIEIEPRTWHSFVALESSALYEIKNGPWDAKTDKNFAPWAPEEGGRDVEKFLKKMQDAIPKEAVSKKTSGKNQTKVIAVGIVQHGNKYLVIKRCDSARFYPGVYEPVCGYLKEFESAEECALRELKEETGLYGKIVKQGNIFEVHDENGRWVVVPFLLKATSGKVILSQEHTAFKWVSPDELNNDEFIRGIKKDFASVGLV